MPLRMKQSWLPGVPTERNLYCEQRSFVCHADLSEAMSIEKRYFTSDLSIRS